MNTSIEHLPIEQCPHDLVTYEDARMFIFCLGPEWRLPTNEERKYLITVAHTNAKHKLAIAWDTDDIPGLTGILDSNEPIDLGLLYVVPVREYNYGLYSVTNN